MDTNTVYADPAQPPVPSPGYAPPAQAPAPKKKGKGCLIAALVVAVLLLCSCAGVAVLVGVLLKPEEPAVVYSDADFDTALAKMQVTWPELPEGADPADYERVYSGQKPMDVVLTSAEVSAMMSYRHNATYWPIKSMAVELTGGNSATATAVVQYAGRDWPVTASGSGTAAAGGLDLTIDSANVAGFDVPAQYLPYGAEFLERMINPRLARAGITIETLEGAGDGIRLAGTMWETAEYVPVQ
ncbi:MAG: hypothetical protein EG823_02800 [Actinobacteria bacterium]|nr:hypothetical protein [Actinomycetota bacterium]